MDAKKARSLRELISTKEPNVVSFDDGALFKTRVAILPAAFNPPTLAHLELLELSKTVNDVHSVAAMLTTQNVSKIAPEESLSHRISMLLAIQKTLDIHVLGVNKAKIVNQALALQSTFPDLAFDFIVGFDTLVRLFDLQFYDGIRAMNLELEAFFDECRLITANRNDDDVSKVRQWISHNAAHWKEKIIVLELNDIMRRYSSTVARADIKDGRVSHALPVVVRNYIDEHKLYRD